MPTPDQILLAAYQAQQAGRLPEAARLYQQVMALQPHNHEALHLLGTIYLASGQPEAALELFTRATTVAPQMYHAHDGRAASLLLLGRYTEAAEAARKAIALAPGYAEAHLHLGYVLQQLGQLPEAAAALRQATALNPRMAVAYVDLGSVLHALGEFAAAETVLRQALTIEPQFTEALINLGAVVAALGRHDEAVATQRRALQLQPNSAAALSNLGNALQALGLLGEAQASYRQALTADPEFATVHSGLLYSLHYLPDATPEEIFAEHLRWAERHAAKLAPGGAPYAADQRVDGRDADRRLRIGYISPDFREHSVAFFLENLLAHHDPNHFEVFCYANHRRADACTARLQRHAACWRPTAGASDEQVAELIRQDQIDILIDLAGHTAGHRLRVLARKPAPVQASYLGYPDTTGLKTVDYLITDAVADPPGLTERFHVEKLIRLPETLACFRPANEAPAVGDLPARVRGQVTFGSFHTLAKLNDSVLTLWARLLAHVPHARLLLVAPGPEDSSCRQRLRGHFAREGIVAERIEFRDRQPLHGYLELHHQVDVALDCFPHSGHTIACHALWMGVPTVTLAGPTRASRLVASVLMNAGLPELIARTPEEYVAIAAGLAGDLTRLKELRATLRERTAQSPLTDGPRFARHFEAALREMWREWCRTSAGPADTATAQ